MRFIVIDGLDASGKTTQAKLLAEFLRMKGHEILLRMHPSDDNILGKEAKYFLQLKGKGAHLGAAIFYMCDVLRSVFLYMWRKYDFVVFVRYLMGTAYLPTPLNIIAYYFFAKVLPTSEWMFFFDIRPEEAYKRVKRREDRLEMFERVDMLRKTRRNTLLLALMNNWIIIDATRAIAKIQKDIRKHVGG